VLAGFKTERLSAGAVTINASWGGDGPPLLLLHGYPQTHVMWRRVASMLAPQFTVVCPDLRGYGDSDKPAARDRGGYSKRVMAADQIEVMRGLGFERFAVVGHDRGGRVALRMALDHPERVSHLTVLDIVPTKTIYETIDQERATTVWRYFFLIQPYDLPERLIAGDPLGYLHRTFDEWCGTPGAMEGEALDEYVRCFDAATIHATCEDYRAGATIDLDHDRSDADRPVECPTLALWSAEGLGRSYDVEDIWRRRAPNFTGAALDCGHFVAEERPDETANALAAHIR
jgi:haloacetate dehalogenase